MKFKWFSLIGKIICVVAMVGILVFTDIEDKFGSTIQNININKTSDILYKIEEREYKYVDTYNLNIGEFTAIEPGTDGIVAYYGEQSRVIRESTLELAWRGTSDPEKIDEIVNYPSVMSFTALITGYGPDCRGCRGFTATGYDVRDTIYYEDSEYGRVRIVAVDASRIKYGSVIRIVNYRDWDPFLAIALDCGGAIHGNDLDLLYSSETLGNKVLGLDKNVDADVIRRGY